MSLRFKAERRNRTAAREPQTFAVAYDVDVDELDEAGGPTGRKVTDEREETFALRGGELSSITLADLTEGGGAVAVRNAVVELFDDDLEYDRFRRFAHRHLDEEDLFAIFEGLVEEATARPTQSPSDSQPEGETTGDDSKVTVLPGGYKVASAS